MIIDGNPKEKRAMELMRTGNRAEGERLQNEFVAAFNEEYANKDHCPCQTACVHHGNCRECVTIHRGHQEHVPNCLRIMLNERIRALSELTEHTIVNEIETPLE